MHHALGIRNGWRQEHVERRTRQPTAGGDGCAGGDEAEKPRGEDKKGAKAEEGERGEKASEGRGEERARRKEKRQERKEGEGEEKEKMRGRRPPLSTLPLPKFTSKYISNPTMKAGRVVEG